MATRVNRWRNRCRMWCITYRRAMFSDRFSQAVHCQMFHVPVMITLGFHMFHVAEVFDAIGFGVRGLIWGAYGPIGARSRSISNIVEDLLVFDQFGCSSASLSTLLSRFGFWSWCSGFGCIFRILVVGVRFCLSFSGLGAQAVFGMNDSVIM